MLEKLITGRFIDLNLKMLNSRPAGLSPAAGNPPHGSFVDSTLMPLNIQQSVSDGIFSRTRSSGLGQGVNNAKVHRNFHWLKWIPPYISQIPLGGVDVFTGPMSGCWVITYRYPGVAAADPVYVGHLGTCEDNAWNNGMKAGWTQFAVNNPAALISGFNPKRAFDGNLGVGNGENVAFFALVTPDSRYYAVKLGRQGMTSKFRIIQVLEVAPTMGNALQTIFT